MTRPILSGISDQRLLSRTQKLARVERRVTISVLAHLNEIEKRKLHLKLGYGSLFEYCTERLGYSAPAAGRRIQTARCVREHPQVFRMLESNEINLTTVAMIAGIMTKENYAVLLKQIRGKSTREVEAIKAGYNGPVKIRDKIKTVYVAVRKQPPAQAVPQKTTLSAESESCGPSSSEPPKDIENKPRTDNTVAVQKRILINFSTSPEFMDKFEEVRAALGHRFKGQPSFEQVFDVVMDSFLDRHSPVRRSKRRERRTCNNSNDVHSPKPASARRSRRPEVGINPLSAPRVNRATRVGLKISQRKAIPAKVRDAVFSKHNGRCSYEGADGRRCNSTFCLQVDHIIPVARGGTDDPSNLRLLCAWHNRLESERVLGANCIYKGDP